MSICYVTAFLDIGRDDWKKFERSFDNYLKSFLPYVDLFRYANHKEHHMIAFIDQKHIQRVKEHIPPHVPISLIPISIQGMRTWPLWKRFDREKEIMESDEYKDFMKHRLQFPEHNNPAYTLINHSKIDFVSAAMQLSNADYFCWTDFGYFHVPEYECTALLDLRKLNLHRINYTLINPIDEKDKDVVYTMQNAPERFGGFWFFGPRVAMQKYKELYHRTHEMFQLAKLCDDDQHLALRCWVQEPELFHLHMLGGWHRALKTFQLPEPEDHIFIGDSHILCFENISSSILEFSGSSIHGLINPDSKSGARREIFEHLNKNQYKKIYLMFGKVDLEWVFPYKNALNPKLDMKDWITTVARNYVQFLIDLCQINHNIIILGIHPPSLDSSNMINRINSGHSVNVVCKQADTALGVPEVKTLQTLQERSENVDIFNKCLENIADKLKLKYYHPPKSMFGSDGKIVCMDMVKPGDHHLQRVTACDAWISDYKELDNRKRVAILICGHLRAFGDVYLSHLKKFMQGAKCDIFVSSHYTSDHSSYEPNRFTRIYYEKDFEKLFEGLPVRGFHIDSDQHPDNDKYNYCWKMWRKVNEAWKMCMDYSMKTGVQYDYVVRTRPDIIVREMPRWDKLPPLNKNLIIGFGPGLGYPDDIFAIAAPNVMEHYCDIKKVIDHKLLPHKVVEYTMNVYPEYGRCLTSILRYNDRIEKFYSPIITDFGNGMFELGHEKSKIGIGTPFVCK